MSPFHGPSAWAITLVSLLTVSALGPGSMGHATDPTGGNDAGPGASGVGYAGTDLAFDLDALLAREVALAVADGAPERPIPVLVTYDHVPTDAEAALLASALDAKVIWTFHRIPVIHAELPATSVMPAARLPGVRALEWDHPMRVALDVAAPAVQALEPDRPDTPYNGRTAEALGYSGAGMVIAVLDTGVDDDHPAFQGKWLAGALTTAGTEECVNPPDDEGHGTHVAGIALGNDVGSAYRGAAPDARLVEIKISANRADAFSGSLRAFEWVLDYNAAIDAGAPKCGVGLEDRIDVATLSFGSCCPRTAGEHMEGLIERLTRSGVVVTIAAGNNGPCDPDDPLCLDPQAQHTLNRPGVAAGAITVANVDDVGTIHRDDDTLARSSSRGPNNDISRDALTDRFRKPEIGAPGTSIMAPGLVVPYMPKTGTSMSTPLVAGIAALLLQAGEEARSSTGGLNLMAPRGTGYQGDGDWSPGEHPVREALAVAADQKTSGVPADMLTAWESEGIHDRPWNNGYGYGEADAFGALCWAWRTILTPRGAPIPADVDATCAAGTAPVVDLRGTLSMDPGAPTEGDVVHFEATVEVEGSPTLAAATVTFVLDLGTSLGSVRIDPLPSYGTVKVTSAAWAATPGPHRVTAFIDADDEVTETWEWNNEPSITFNVPRKPFFTLDLELPDDSGAGRHTFDLAEDLTQVEVAGHCPSAVLALEIVRVTRSSQVPVPLHARCELGAVSSVTPDFASGTYEATWQAAGTGPVHIRVAGRAS